MFGRKGTRLPLNKVDFVAQLLSEAQGLCEGDKTGQSQGLGQGQLDCVKGRSQEFLLKAVQELDKHAQDSTKMFRRLFDLNRETVFHRSSKKVSIIFPSPS